MSKSSLILVIFTTIALLANPVFSQAQRPTHQAAICDNLLGKTDSADSPYSTNINTVLTTLQTQSSTSAKFYNTNSGAGTDTVYGQYYCRGDIDTNLCRDCITGGTNWALASCNQTKGAIVLNNDCTLRYSNHSMYGILEARADTFTPSMVASTSANVSDQVAFPGVLSDTVRKVVDEAVRASNLFATGEGEVSASETVYCLVQCSPDLSPAQCRTCLDSLYSYVSKPQEQWPAFIYAFDPSCLMMYNVDEVFYSNPPTTSPPPTTAP